jgi:hypothetical protein
MADEEVDWGMEDYNDDAVKEDQAAPTKANSELACDHNIAPAVIRGQRRSAADYSPGLAFSGEEFQGHSYWAQGQPGRCGRAG